MMTKKTKSILLYLFISSVLHFVGFDGIVYGAEVIVNPRIQFKVGSLTITANQPVGVAVEESFCSALISDSEWKQYFKDNFNTIITQGKTFQEHYEDMEKAFFERLKTQGLSDTDARDKLMTIFHPIEIITDSNVLIAVPDGSGDPTASYGVFADKFYNDSKPPKDLADLKEYIQTFLQNPTVIYQFDLGTMQLYVEQMNNYNRALKYFYEQTKQEGMVHIKDRVEFRGTQKQLETWLQERRKTASQPSGNVFDTVNTIFGTFTQDGRQVFGVYNGNRVADKVPFREKQEVRQFLISLGMGEQRELPFVGIDGEFDAFLQYFIDNSSTPYSLYEQLKNNGVHMPERQVYTETIDEKHARLSLLAQMGGLSEYYLVQTNAGAWIP